MKKTSILFAIVILNVCAFSQVKWELMQEQKSQFTESLSSGCINYHVFAVGSVTSSAYAQHVIVTDQWRISRDHISAMDSPRAVYALGKNDVWACGDKGLIAHSGIRGNEGTWEVQPTPTKEKLQSICFTDTNLGWAVGSNATILFTKDGGENWKSQNSPLNMNFIKVIFTDQYNGYILADKVGSNYKGKILKTTDGGASWNAYEFHCSIQDFVSSMFFYDTQNGWICGKGGFISCTSDGGLTWTTQQRYINGTKSLNDIHFRTLNEGWACGLRGLLYHTTDGGKTWAEQDIGEQHHFTALEFNGPYLGWLSTAGKIYQYMDPRFDKYRVDYLQNGPPKSTSASIPAKKAIPFTSIQNETNWEIRSYDNNISELNKAFSQMQNEGFMPVGLNLVHNQMEVFVVKSQPFETSQWTMKNYNSIDGLSSGINQMIESGYLPFGMTLENNNFNILFAKTNYIGHGWQIVESELDHKDVVNDIQPHLENGYIPVGVSLFAGYYYTLLVQPNEFPVTNYSIQGYSASQPAVLKNGIEEEKNVGSLPQGYFKQDGVINILYNRF